MKKLRIGFIYLFLALALKVNGMTLYSTLDTNSTEGNYFGALYFAFSSTNSSDYQSNGMAWHTTTDYQTFTDAVSGSQIVVNFLAGGGGTPNALNLFDIIIATDPAFEGYLSVNEVGGGDEQDQFFTIGQAKVFTYANNGSSQFYFPALNFGGNCTFGYSLTGNFDGTSGTGVGSWYINYPFPPTTPTPEPAAVWQMAVGGFCLWLIKTKLPKSTRSTK